MDARGHGVSNLVCVGNDRIKLDLGVALVHPTYREGLKAALSA